ncbi:hypothetical protein [Thermococcus sp. MAR1]|uniref:hypothetical protein n=1 Tax=Thermococcus sp. MAR1 TaxID=1638263 RepID=UPI0014393710|nr:hypothetical protein [Thermococcus sp. MAR1]NJE11461.1 hypothetical protein [Thermococcus sp. MAR1]
MGDCLLRGIAGLVVVGFIVLMFLVTTWEWGLVQHGATSGEKVTIPLSFSNDSSASVPANTVESTPSSVFSGESREQVPSTSEEAEPLNLSQEEALQLRTSLQNFTQSLWESISTYGYDNVTIVLATSIASLPMLPECGNLSGYQNLTTYSEEVSNLTVALHKYKNLAEGLSKDYGIELPYLNEGEIRRLKNTLKPSQVEDMFMMCSFARDYNRLIIAAGQVVPGDRGTYSAFYERLFVVGLELIFMKENVAYKVSYKLVGNLLWKTRLFHVIYRYGGSTALKVVMSTMHWESRGLINRYFEAFGDNPEMVEELISKVDNPDWVQAQVSSLGKLLGNKTKELIGNKTDLVDKLKGLFGSDDG